MPLLLGMGLGCFVVTRLFGGYDIDASRAYWSPTVFARPTTVSMDRSATVVALLRARAGGLDSIGVRRNGIERVLQPPSEETLRRAFPAAQLAPSGLPIFPNATIASVAIASGAPIVTVTNPIEGAYSGTETASFRWNGLNWRQLFVADAKHRENVWVAGASSGTTVFGIDALAESPAELANVPYPSATGAFLVTERGIKRIAGAIPTGAGVRSFWGYRIASADHASSVPRAAAWTRSGERDIVTGVVWDANSADVFVGDDRARLDTIGRPIAVVGSTTRTLGTDRGSAFGVNSSQLVVGSLVAGPDSDAGFLFNLRSDRLPTRLDDLLERSAYRITEAYSIADDGSIVALAERAGDVRFVLLTPTTHHPPCTR